MKKKVNLFLAGVATMFLLAGCGGGKEQAAAGPKDTLMIAHPADAKTLDPHDTNDSASLKVAAQIYSRLVEQDRNLNVVPSVAESWEQLDDKTTLFHLRKGVKFHNGEELKASDVKFTFERMLKSPKVSVIIGAVDRVEVVDDYTVKVITKEPFGPLLNHLTHTATSILNEKAVNEAGASYGQHPVGTGPYKFVDWQSGDRITLTSNPDYFLGETPIKNVVFRAIVENSNRTIALETGEVDIAYEIDGLDKQRLKDDKNINFIEVPSLIVSYVGFNTQKAPFDNVKVRQAVAHAIQVDDIIDAVYKGSAEKGSSLIGPKVKGATEKAELIPYNQDIAKQLLKEAGYPEGFKTKIWINDAPLRRDIAVILQDQLKQIGIDLEVETLEWGAYLEGTARGDHEMFVLGWGTVTGDADYGLYPLLHSKSSGGAGNRAFYHNDKVDELLDKAKTSVNQADRDAMYEQVQLIAREEVPYYIVGYPTQNAATRSNIENFGLKASGQHSIYGVKFAEPNKK